MCVVCGCDGAGQSIESAESETHEHEHTHSHDGDVHYGLGPAHAHAPGMSQARMVEVEENILSKNNEYARDNRQWLGERGVLAINMLSSPGSGKTTLLTRTITDLGESTSVSVIEGDQQTANDADRIRATGARAIQINTGKGCHLDGHMVGHALETLAPDTDSVLFIENVGNLVCPSAFDLGERFRVVILSVTEGEDKPLKYPDMFATADLMLLNKADLLPYLDFDVDACIENARRINPNLAVLQVSATKGDGMQRWYDWIQAARTLARVSA
ncbi:MAG: hydrogenase nickel incorporation protein HypB [Pseudomonadota bacterium]